MPNPVLDPVLDPAPTPVTPSSDRLVAPGVSEAYPWQWRSMALAGATGSQVFAALLGDRLGTDDPVTGQAADPVQDQSIDPADPKPLTGVGPIDPQAIACLLESPASPTSPDGPDGPDGRSAASLALGRYSIAAAGARRILTPPIGSILTTLRSAIGRPITPEPAQRTPARQDRAEPDWPNDLPFIGGWLGWLGYDLAWEIERLPEKNRDTLPFPVAFWFQPQRFAVADHQADRLWWFADSAAGLADLVDRWPAAHQVPTDEPPKISLAGPAHGPDPTPPAEPDLGSHLHFVSDRPTYLAAVDRAKAHIRAGDIFQANLSLRFGTTTRSSGWQIYQALQRINPSPFASYWRSPWGEVMSCSPERLVSLRGRRAETRPIAGTRRRGATTTEDAALAAELLAHPKERAEHAMLVDLERNDLGRVCQWGTVEVDEFFTIERYSHVMHLVSNVAGRLADGQDAIDLIRASFPGGTITGCPKVRCLEIIEDLEPVRRSLFYGSCGYLDWRGDLDLNILIRTLLLPNPAWPGQALADQVSPEQVSPEPVWPNQTPADRSAPATDRWVWGQVGAGIVADSDPEREWQESIAKAEAQLAAIAQAQHHPAAKRE